VVRLEKRLLQNIGKMKVQEQKEEKVKKM